MFLVCARRAFVNEAVTIVITDKEVYRGCSGVWHDITEFEKCKIGSKPWDRSNIIDIAPYKFTPEHLEPEM